MTNVATELGALAALPEDQINTCDVPEQRDWSGAKRGVFSRLVEDLDEETLKAIAGGEVPDEYAALDNILKDWTP